MKILLVQPYALGPGHYDAYTKRLCEGFCCAGVDVTLVTAAGTKNHWEKQLQIKSIESIKYNSGVIFKIENNHRLKFIGKIKKVFKFVLTSWRVEKKAFSVFNKENYDALHFIDSELITLVTLFWIFKKPKKVFLTVPAPYEMQNKFYQYTYNPIRKIVAQWLFKYIKLISHTEYVKKSLIDLNIASEETISVIPWGVDEASDDYSRTEIRKALGIAENKKVFGFFGYLLDQKGFDFTLENWANINKNFILLSRVHSDYSGDKTRIENFIKEKNIKDRIFVTFGYTSEKDLAMNICACNAILLPYKKFFQGESGIMSLACSHGIPLIASNVGKIGKVVEENGLGIVFEPESSLSFKKALQKFADLNERDIEKINENIDLYAKSLSWREIAILHINFYGI